MNKMIHLTGSELASALGGTAGENDNLARDIGQYLGGYVGAYVHHPFLCSLPIFGGFYANWSGFKSAAN